METSETPISSMPNCCPPSTNPIFKWACLFVGLLIALVLFLNAYLLWQKSTISTIPTSTTQPSTVQPSTVSPSTDPTAGWKTYTHIKYGYSFKYPSEMIIRPFDSSESIENSTIIYVSMPDAPGKGIITINSRPYQKKTSFADAIRDVFVSEPNKQGTNTLVDDRPAFFTSSDGEIDTKEKYKTYYVLIQQDDYNYKILRSNYILPNKNEQDKKIFDQILSTFKFVNDLPQPTPTQMNGVGLKDIKYKLPQDWSAKLNNDSLFISPVNGGGFLSIRVYDYSGNVGRREYYCQISKVCIEGTSYFTEMNIGNISGYIANALDNSGGGSEYFGAKGNKFYIINSYDPPSPNEFEKNYKNVLNSLIF